MKYLFDEWGKIKKDLAGKNIFLFLDYDGTLASIADHPDKAFLSAGIKKILKELTKDQRFRIAVISGRSLKDIKKRVSIKEIIFSGNHGLEIEGPEFKYRNQVAASYNKLLGKIKKELNLALNSFSGVLIEDKKLTLSIHYRLADKKTIVKIRKAFNKVIADYITEEKIKVRTGKMIFEIIPPVVWNKGLAVLWILERPEFSGNSFIPLYFGDDITDEDAFGVLKKRGVTILVGYRKNSLARYYLNDVTEVGQFAELL